MQPGGKIECKNSEIAVARYQLEETRESILHNQARNL